MDDELRDAREFMDHSSKQDSKDEKSKRQRTDDKDNHTFTLTNLGQNAASSNHQRQLHPDLQPEKAQPGTQSFTLTNLGGGGKPLEFKIEGRGTYKMALCMYFETKGCGKGDTCTYAHGAEELKVNIERQGGFNKSVMCKFFEQGSCRNGKACRFAHSTDEMKEADHAKQGHAVGLKTSPCKFFENGYCGRGDLCSFAHGESVIQAAQAQDAEKTMDGLLHHEAQHLMGQGLSSEDAKALAEARRGKGKGSLDSGGFKTKICQFWEQGSCQKGNDCTFAHGSDERHSSLVAKGEAKGKKYNGKGSGKSPLGGPLPVPPPPPLAPAMAARRQHNAEAMAEILVLMCPANHNSKCKDGDQCNLAHTVDDVVAGLIACGVCTLHLVTECQSGSSCQFPHVAEEQKACIDSLRPCKLYAMGQCVEGHNCRFMHESPPSVSDSGAQMLKALVCQSNLYGRCTNGGNCVYAHSDEELIMLSAP